MEARSVHSNRLGDVGSIRSLRLACALAASYSLRYKRPVSFAVDRSFNRANVWETPQKQGCGRSGSAVLPASVVKAFVFQRDVSGESSKRNSMSSHLVT